MEIVAALTPPAVMIVLFVSLLVTAYRATDGSRKRDDNSKKTK